MLLNTSPYIQRVEQKWRELGFRRRIVVGREGGKKRDPAAITRGRMPFGDIRETFLRNMNVLGSRKLPFVILNLKANICNIRTEILYRAVSI